MERGRRDSSTISRRGMAGRNPVLELRRRGSSTMSLRGMAGRNPILELGRRDSSTDVLFGAEGVGEEASGAAGGEEGGGLHIRNLTTPTHEGGELSSRGKRPFKVFRFENTQLMGVRHSWLFWYLALFL